MDMQDALPDGQWLTYGRLAVIRGISRGSAERLARRMKWRRQAGNDGFARVFVPQAFLERAGAKAKDNPGDDHGDEPPAPDAFLTALSMLEKQLAREGARADKAEAKIAELQLRTEDLTTRLDEAETRAKRALQAAKEAQAFAESETMARAEAEAGVAELRRAEAGRQGQGRWARLRAAWRRG